MDEQLRELDATHRYRRRRIVESAQGRELRLDGRQLINFCSNDYLGLANDPRVREAFRAGVEQWGGGTGASHLVCGHTRAHHELEEALAEFTGRARCLLFSSGYAANLGAVAGLLGKGDQMFQDRLNHASLLDGALLSGARFRRYRHRDTEDLHQKLDTAAARPGRKLIISDGTFSMDGTTAHIAQLAACAEAQDAWLMIDEAHSLGVLGREGRGIVAGDAALNDRVQILVGTLGKALGTHGGFVAGSEALIESLIQSARTYIYTTALPAAVATATMTSLAISQAEEWRRERLRELVGGFRAGAEQMGLPLLESATPIQPVVLGAEESALELSAALEEQGLLVGAIRPPTVPRGTSRLRITLTAEHTDSDLDRLLDALESCYRPA
jgi:8-amino-7-oxononanoate synthase